MQKSRIVRPLAQPYSCGMRLIPTHCQSCYRAALVPASAIDSNGESSCRQCGTKTRVLPGQSYAPEDAQLFDSLQAVLHEAQLTPLNASQLHGELEGRVGQPGLALERLIRALPSLATLELVVSNEPSALRKAEGMLVTLLDALAASHDVSDPHADAPKRQGLA